MYIEIHCSDVSHNYNRVWNVDLHNIVPIDVITVHILML